MSAVEVVEAPVGVPDLRPSARALQLGFGALLVVDGGILGTLLSFFASVDHARVDGFSAVSGTIAGAVSHLDVWLTLHLLVVVAVVLAWVVWFVGARTHADHYVEPEPSRHPLIRAVWGWVVPGPNLTVPFHRTMHIHDAISRHDGLTDEQERAYRRGRKLITGWWSIRVIQLSAGWFAFVVAADRDELTVVKVSMLVVVLLEIVAAILAVLVVRRITAVADARHAS